MVSSKHDRPAEPYKQDATECDQFICKCKNALRTRFSGHSFDVLHKKDRPIANHFNLPDHSIDAMTSQKFGLIAFRDDLSCGVYNINDINGPRRKVTGASVKVDIKGVTKRGTLVSTADQKKSLLLEKEKLDVAKYFGLPNKAKAKIHVHQHATRFNTKRKLELKQNLTVERSPKARKRLRISKIPIRVGARMPLPRKTTCCSCKATQSNTPNIHQPNTDSFIELPVFSPLPDCISPLSSVPSSDTAVPAAPSPIPFLLTPIHTSSPIINTSKSSYTRLNDRSYRSPILIDPSTPSTSFASSSSESDTEHLIKPFSSLAIPSHYKSPLFIEPPTPSVNSSNHIFDISLSGIESLLQSFTGNHTPVQEPIDSSHYPLTNQLIVSAPRKKPAIHPSKFGITNVRRSINFDTDLSSTAPNTFVQNSYDAIASTSYNSNDISSKDILQHWIQEPVPPTTADNYFLMYQNRLHESENPEQFDAQIRSPKHWVYSSTNTDEIKIYSDEQTNTESANNLSPLVSSPSESVITNPIQQYAPSSSNLTSDTQLRKPCQNVNFTHTDLTHPTIINNVNLPANQLIPNTSLNTQSSNSVYTPFRESLVHPIHSTSDQQLNLRPPVYNGPLQPGTHLYLPVFQPQLPFVENPNTSNYSYSTTQLLPGSRTIQKPLSNTVLTKTRNVYQGQYDTQMTINVQNNQPTLPTMLIRTPVFEKEKIRLPVDHQQNYTSTTNTKYSIINTFPLPTPYNSTPAVKSQDLNTPSSVFIQGQKPQTGPIFQVPNPPLPLTSVGPGVGLQQLTRPEPCPTPLPSIPTLISKPMPSNHTTAEKEIAKRISKYAVIDDPRLVQLTGANIMKRFITSQYVQNVLDQLPDKPPSETIQYPYLIDSGILRQASCERFENPKDLVIFLFDRIFTVKEFRGRSVNGIRRPSLCKFKMESIKLIVNNAFAMDDKKWKNCYTSLNVHIRTLDRKINRLHWLRIDNY